MKISVPAILRETSEGTSYLIVRLVFRPYRQLRRTICTSVSLRTSTRVSSGFILVTHSSQSFGSQQIRSCSNLSRKSRSADSAKTTLPCEKVIFSYQRHQKNNALCFHYAPRFATWALAHVLDSLVRVSRRDNQCRSANIFHFHTNKYLATRDI